MLSVTQLRTRVDVGHLKDAPNKRHVVVKVQNGWVLMCTRKPARRDGGNHLVAEVSCKACSDAIQDVIAYTPTKETS